MVKSCKVSHISSDASYNITLLIWLLYHLPDWIWILRVWFATHSDNCLHRTQSANRLGRHQFSGPIGRHKPLGGCVSLARFQDLALAHWTHSAGKNSVQRGIHHLQHRLLSPLLFQESTGKERRERHTHRRRWLLRLVQTKMFFHFLLEIFNNLFFYCDSLISHMSRWCFKMSWTLSVCSLRHLASSLAQQEHFVLLCLSLVVQLFWEQTSEGQYGTMGGLCNWLVI